MTTRKKSTARRRTDPKRRATSQRRPASKGRASSKKRRDGGKRTALAIREAIGAALGQDRDLMEEVGGGRPEKPRSDSRVFIQAAGALEPVLANAVKRHPSFLGRLAYGTAQLVSTLASEDASSGRRLAEMASGSHVGLVFVDVVGFTAFTSSNGDEAAVELVGRLEKVVANVCRRHEGEVVKHLGDGFLLAFPSASRAVRAALALRDAVRKIRERDPSFQMVRIAVHAGRPSVVRDDLIGHDVNLTARILEHCEPGEILVTEDAKTLAERRLRSLRFISAGRVKARGVPDRVATYRVEQAAATS